MKVLRRIFTSVDSAGLVKLPRKTLYYSAVNVQELWVASIWPASNHGSRSNVNQKNQPTSVASSGRLLSVRSARLLIHL